MLEEVESWLNDPLASSGGRPRERLDVPEATIGGILSSIMIRCVSHL